MRITITRLINSSQLWDVLGQYIDVDITDNFDGTCDISIDTTKSNISLMTQQNHVVLLCEGFVGSRSRNDFERIRIV